MQTLPISAAKSRLSELIDTAQLTREEYTITVNGSPAAMLVSIEEWESLKETLFWLSQDGIHESIAQAREEVAAGRGLGEDEVRARFGVPKRAGR